MGRVSCGEEMQACKHQYKVDHLVDENFRKEREIKNQKRLKNELAKKLEDQERELADIKIALERKSFECDGKDKRIEELEDKIKPLEELPELVKRWANGDSVAFERVTEVINMERVTTRWTYGGKRPLSELDGNEPAGKRRLGQ